jgi:hypothetical protein
MSEFGPVSTMPQRGDMSEVEGQVDITRTSSISVVDPTLTLDTAFTRGVAKGPRASTGAEFAQIIQAPSRGSGHGTSERWFGLTVVSIVETPNTLAALAKPTTLFTTIVGSWLS